jgi:enoyl-CoA hydratase
MHFETIHLGIEEGLATITIDRPKFLNALSPTVLTELTMAVAELEVNDEVKVVLLTGEGKAFVAGADIAAMAEMSAREAQSFAEVGGALGRSIEESAMPFIAAVNGFALGGGCELALACDFIYASTKAKFGQPEVKLGVIPGFGGTQRLARRVGVAKAKELIFTGDMISAEEGLRIGLVDQLCEPDELMGKVRETASRIAANGSLAVGEAKRVIHEGQSMTLEHGNRLEQLAFAVLFDSDDQKEGMAAFLGKRDPEFKNQ